MTKDIYQVYQDYQGNITTEAGDNLVQTTVNHDNGLFRIGAYRVSVRNEGIFKVTEYLDCILTVGGIRQELLKGRNTKGNRAKAIEMAKTYVEEGGLITRLLEKVGA